MSHNIDLNVMNMRTDLAIDEVNNEELEKLKEEKENGIKVFTVDVTKENQDKFNKKCGKYITIAFDDVTDYNNSINVEKVFTSELKKMIESHNIPSSASCIIIGLGNEKSTPDSLGPLSINDIIVTNHLFSLGINVEDGFRVVSAFNPGVMGQTGIETSDIIYALMPQKKLTYEQAMQRLETIVQGFEQNTLELDQLTAQLAEAQQLIKMCNDKLQQVETDVKQILNNEQE